MKQVCVAVMMVWWRGCTLQWCGEAGVCSCDDDVVERMCAAAMIGMLLW